MWVPSERFSLMVQMPPVPEGLKPKPHHLMWFLRNELGPNAEQKFMRKHNIKTTRINLSA